MAEITPAEQIRLNLLSTLNYDTAAAKEAIEFVKDSELKYQIFIQQFNRVVSESTVVAKTIKAIPAPPGGSFQAIYSGQLPQRI
ncbi:DUF2560 family protein [Raoultella sp. Lac2]|uniref:DUF2560 family protein n=1 Tax=Klebsiella/Raoultella group TaxID=2890311 RepID=UPI00135252A8|nr:DUF2560 family protein [Raoultella sp. Lac2]MXF98302.1 DUF2560 family protein [Raoultella sp. Lac1]